MEINTVEFFKNIMQSLSLALTLSSAIFLVRSSRSMKPMNIIQASEAWLSAPGTGGNPEVIRSLIKQKVGAKVGLCLLVLGCAFQVPNISLPVTLMVSGGSKISHIWTLLSWDWFGIFVLCFGFTYSVGHVWYRYEKNKLQDHIKKMQKGEKDSLAAGGE